MKSDEREFYKKKETDKVYWVDNTKEIRSSNKEIGLFLFSFDKKKIYNLFADYPHNMTEEEVEIFDKDNPEWANFFRSRKKR